MALYKDGIMKTDTAEADALKAHSEIVSRLQAFDDGDKKHILDMAYQWFNFTIAPKMPALSYVTEPDPPEGSPVGLFSQKSDLTPKDFLIEKNPQTNIERVVCLAYYLNHYRDMPSFKTLDISKLNTEAAQPKFTNPTVAVNDTAKSGFVVASTKGAKQISAMGEQFVLALPDRDAAKKIKQKMKPKRRKKSAAKKNKGKQSADQQANVHG